MLSAFVSSDPIKTPAAADIFTAYELGQALYSKYSNVQVRYLRRGNQWYAVQHLYDVDVLITQLDAYDLSKILPLYQRSSKSRGAQNQMLPVELRLKPHFTAIAWMRNWFNRWLSRSWIGNYDLYLTSSSLSKKFFDRIGQEIGFSVHCAIRCPKSGPSTSLFNKRRMVPSYIYPLATSVHQQLATGSSFTSRRAARRSTRFAGMAATSMGNMSNTTIGNMGHEVNKHDFNLVAWTAQMFRGVHYILAGSYYEQPRSIISFDPSLIPMWKGRVIGQGWAAAPNMSSWADICVGRLPYEVVKEVTILLLDSTCNHGCYFMSRPTSLSS
jgi:hypothetical protein